MKIPIIRKGEYDIWSMRMRQYICHTDHNLWDVIVNEDLEEEPAPTGETSAPPAPKTAKQLAAKRNQERMLNHSGKQSNQGLSLDKAYDRFQKLISQLEVHGAPISKEDINQKFLRSLPPSWNQIALIMRNKPDIDEIDIDDLYHNLRVYEDGMKCTNSGDFGVSTAGGISQVSSALCAHDVASRRNQGKRSYGDNGRSNAPTNESSSHALGAQDGLGGYDWSNDLKWLNRQYALMAQKNFYSSSSLSSSDNEVQKCSKQSLESFKTLQKNYDSKREKHRRARLEIQGYELALESLESRILIHEKNELAWVYESVNRDKVIIEDWNSDDEDDVSEVQTVSPVKTNETQTENPKILLQDHAVVDSGCSSHMTGNKPYLFDYEDYNGGFVAFGSDPKGEFKNHAMNEFCAKNGIKREFSVARTPQQKGKIGPLLRKLELCNSPSISFMRPFGCPLAILNTLDSLGNFDGKSNEGYLLGTLPLSKAFRSIQQIGTKRVEENCTLDVSENHKCGSSRKDKGPTQEYILLPLQPYKTRIPVEDVAPAAHEKPSKSSLKDNNVQDSKDVADKEGQHQIKEDEQVLHDELEKMIAQEVVQMLDESYLSILEVKYLIDATTLPNADFYPVIQIRIHKNHPKDEILGDPKSIVQTRRFKRILQHNKHWKKAIGTKWVFKNKRDERSIVVKNKARLVAQGFRQEEGIDYDEVFAPVVRIEAIMLFLAFASYMGFTVYQMDVKSAFLYGTIEEEVYVHQPPGFVDPAHPNKVYKVIKALYGLHQAPRAWYETLSSFLMENGFRRGTIDKTLFIKKKKSDIMLVQVYVDDIIFGSTKKSMCTEFEDCMHKRFQMSSIGELTFFLGLQVKQQPDGIFISQDKYVADILKKFDFWSIRTATTPIESNKPLVKDEDGEDVDVHVYRSMIGSLMYLTALRPDIMFAVCACARFQVTPKASHLNAVKRIFSDYGGASLDRKSTTGGCQFIGRRLIFWQCKKQTIVENSTTEAEYVAAANCCGQVLWIQNQMMDYGFNFMNTKIHIDNENTISVIKNPVAHSRTKHIEI
ncbi:putative ribonuclease H-like domain-containing protein [Tanacetum coccineum]